MKLSHVAALALISSVAAANPSGHKWFPSKLPVHYTVFAHDTIKGLPAGSYNTQVLPRVQASFANWTSSRVTCTNWMTQYDGTFTTPSDAKAQNGDDNINRVIWLGGTQWRYSSTTLGLTTTTYIGTTGEILDADMELNNNVTWASDGTATAYDFESVLLHEAGHFLGLDHSPNVSTAVMFPDVVQGQAKRVLTKTDIDDVCAVYPKSTTTTGAQGDPCTASNQCNTGLVCRGPKAGGGKICTVDCTSNDSLCTALAPLLCTDADTGKACLPAAFGSDYCKFCVDGTDCASGLCLSDGKGHLWCSKSCGASAACPQGSTCLDVSSGAACGSSGSCVCAPAETAAGYMCPNQCTGSACGLTPGFGCSNGTCHATGNEGDRCELSGFCKPCQLCAGTNEVAYCRKCCAGAGGSGQCASCTNANCTVGYSCLTVVNSTDGVCAPNGSIDSCRQCSTTTPCPNGETCLGGKCHAACDPSNTGACGACSVDKHLCACVGEVRELDQACGDSPVGICRNGLVCSGGVCRSKCVIGLESSCPRGKTCQMVSGQAVCTLNPPGSVCAPCSGTSCEAGSACYQGRCYQTCNVTVKGGPCDSACTDVGGGLNVCVCDEQIQPSDAPCGANPLRGCGTGLTCVEGFCRGDCNPTRASCPVGTECKGVKGVPSAYACQPTTVIQPDGGFNCSVTPSPCPAGTICMTHPDGTMFCDSPSGTCDPKGAPCDSGKVCRADTNNPSVFRCQEAPPSTGCGCGTLSSVELWLAACVLFVRRRRHAT